MTRPFNASETTAESDFSQTRRDPREGVPRQLPLALPEHPAGYARANYLVTEANAAAFEAATAWLASNDPALAICGAAGSGKTHLAHALAEDASGRFAELETARAEADKDENAFILIDEIDAVDDQKRLLEVVEDLRANRARAVFIGAGAPRDWARGLEDLATRFEAMARATLFEPDETLMRAVLAKAFRDRQIKVDDAVIDYALPRLARTFAAARAFVNAADQTALEEKRPISIATARKVLDNLSEGPQKP